MTVKTITYNFGTGDIDDIATYTYIILDDKIDVEATVTNIIKTLKNGDEDYYNTIELNRVLHEHGVYVVGMEHSLNIDF